MVKKFLKRILSIFYSIEYFIIDTEIVLVRIIVLNIFVDTIMIISN